MVIVSITPVWGAALVVARVDARRMRVLARECILSQVIARVVSCGAVMGEPWWED